MKKLYQRKMPDNAFQIYFFVSLVFFLYLGLTNEIPIKDMPAILNTYIIVEIAIISVAIVAMSMTKEDKRKEVYENFFGVVGFSSIFLMLFVLAYLYCFIKGANYFWSNLSLFLISWMMFLSLFMLVFAVMKFYPDLTNTK